MEQMTVREYASVERISLGTAYRRLWEGRVKGVKIDGRWVIALEAVSSDERDEE
jgi:hypothetical protein